MNHCTEHSFLRLLSIGMVLVSELPASADASSQAAPAAQTQAPADAGREVARLRDELTQEAARLALRQLPANDVVREITEAILNGAFRADTAGAELAYGTLIARVADPEYSDALGPLSIGAPFLALVEGTTHASPYVRRVSAKALGGARPEQRALVVDPLRGMLATRDWITVQHAAVALGRIGAPASSALDALLDLVRDPDEERRQALTAYAESERAAGRRVHDDLEGSLRTAAALARTRIASPIVDLDLYPKLDAAGQTAAVAALGADYQRRFYPSESQKTPGPDATQRAAQHVAVTNALATLFENAAIPVSVRADVLRVVSGQLVSRDLAAPVKAASLQILESALAGSELELKAVAERVRDEIARRSR
jgi:hypothetical protein